MNGLLNFMQSMIEGFPDLKESRKDALTNVVKSRKVDTCFTNDTGKWETAIENKDGQFIVVEVYDNGKEEAVIGHQKWLSRFKQNPNMELESVGFEEWVGFE